MSRGQRARILIVDPIDPEAISDLERSFEVTVCLQPSPSELLDLVADAEVVVLRSGVRMTAAVIGAAPRLKLIARAGTGVDNIDLAAARKAGIHVFNIPGQSANAVAELAIGLMLTAARRIALGDARLRRGRANKRHFVGTELRHRTLGVIGLGAIGQRIAELGAAFDMKVVACVASPSDQRRAALSRRGIELVDLSQLLVEADFVCLACPLTATTRGLIGWDEMQTMKPTAYLINVSRAGVLDEAALGRALSSKTIAAAAVDVLSSERDGSHLSVHENLVMTPHIGAMTTATQQRIGEKLVEGIKAGLQGEQIEHLIC